MLIAGYPEEKKAAAFKKAAQSGSWASSAPTPMTQTNKVFLLLFVHKK
jgi:hypothetical protein